MSNQSLVTLNTGASTPSTIFSGRTIPVTTTLTDPNTGRIYVSQTGVRYPTIRQQTVSPNWHPNSPSSIIFHPSRRLEHRNPQSGILIAILIILIAVIIGIFIWAIWLHSTQVEKRNEQQRNQMHQL